MGGYGRVMKFTEAQLESAIIEPGEPKGSNDEC
jgi:hypothetical protein